MDVHISHTAPLCSPPGPSRSRWNAWSHGSHRTRSCVHRRSATWGCTSWDSMAFMEFNVHTTTGGNGSSIYSDLGDGLLILYPHYTKLWSLEQGKRWWCFNASSKFSNSLKTIKKPLPMPLLLTSLHLTTGTPSNHQLPWCPAHAKDLVKLLLDERSNVLLNIVPWSPRMGLSNHRSRWPWLCRGEAWWTLSEIGDARHENPSYGTASPEIIVEHRIYSWIGTPLKDFRSAIVDGEMCMAEIPLFDQTNANSAVHPAAWFLNRWGLSENRAPQTYLIIPFCYLTSIVIKWGIHPFPVQTCIPTVVRMTQNHSTSPQQHVI